MAKLKIEGSFVALITPSNRDGSVDFEGFRTLIDFQASHGTSALLIMGSTGEVSMLSQEERHSIISETVKYRQAGMLMFYGCTGTTTQSTIDMVRYAAKEGADGAIITVPSYICPSVEDAVTYCLEVADASAIPLGIYNNPGRVGTDLPAEAIVRLAEHPNIVVDKEATTRAGQIAQIAAARKELSLMCCDSPHLGHVMQVMSLGGQGTANMTGNVAPHELAIISKPWTSFEDAAQCRETFLHILPLFHFTYSRINPVPVKSLMKALGLPAGDLRKPYRNLEGAELQRGVEIVKQLGLVEKYQFSLTEVLRKSA
jgi:4-hydroxy-tetrahydrodipicolinate synthase